MSRLGATDQLFHEAIVAVSHNDVLVNVLETLRRRVHAVRSFANEAVDLVKRTDDERLMVCDALESRDPHEAARLLGAHIDDVRESALTALTDATVDR